MSKPFLAAFGVAIAVIAVLVWQGFVSTKGNHLDPAGKIGKVREQKVDENETIVILDFKLKNDADIPMVVRNVDARLEAGDGASVDGNVIAGSDLANFFRNSPGIGEQYNPPLRPRDTVGPHEETDRMVGVRFDAPDDVIRNRKNIVLRIEDVTGPVLELKAK